MDPNVIKYLLYLTKVVDGLAGAALSVPAAKQAVQAEMTALRAMITEGRPPSDDEYLALDNSMVALRDQLQTD